MRNLVSTRPPHTILSTALNIHELSKTRKCDVHQTICTSPPLGLLIKGCMDPKVSNLRLKDIDTECSTYSVQDKYYVTSWISDAIRMFKSKTNGKPRYVQVCQYNHVYTN